MLLIQVDSVLIQKILASIVIILVAYLIIRKILKDIKEE